MVPVSDKLLNYLRLRHKENYEQTSGVANMLDAPKPADDKRYRDLPPLTPAELAALRDRTPKPKIDFGLKDMRIGDRLKIPADLLDSRPGTIHRAEARLLRIFTKHHKSSEYDREHDEWHDPATPPYDYYVVTRIY
jgi:hypothetical protein